MPSAVRCAPISSTSIFRLNGSRCGRRARAMPRACWWCSPARRSTTASSRDLPDFLRAGDQLVVNDTKVIAAQLTGRRLGRGTEPRIEATLIKRIDGSRWQALVKPAKRLTRGRHRPLRRRRAGLLPRPARCHGGGEGRGRRGDVRLHVSRAGARPGDRRDGRDAAAALHRLQARASTSATRPTTRPCSRARRGRSPRRPPACILRRRSRRRCARRARRSSA